MATQTTPNKVSTTTVNSSAFRAICRGVCTSRWGWRPGLRHRFPGREERSVQRPLPHVERLLLYRCPGCDLSAST